MLEENRLSLPEFNTSKTHSRPLSNVEFAVFGTSSSPGRKLGRADVGDGNRRLWVDEVNIWNPEQRCAISRE